MNSKKFIAGICTLALIVSCISFPAAAADSFTPPTYEKSTKRSYVVWDTFEDGDKSDWYFRNNAEGTAATATIETEGENKFLRLSMTKNNRFHESNQSDDKSPNAFNVVLSRKFSDGQFKPDMSGYTILEVKTRSSNDIATRKFIANYPYPGEKYANGTKTYDYSINALGAFGWNTRILFRTNAGNKKFSYVHKNAAGNNSHQGDGTILASYNLDQWYTMKFVYDNVNATQTVYLYKNMPDGTESFVTKTQAQPMSAWWYNYHDKNKLYPLEEKLVYDLTMLFVQNPYTSAFATDTPETVDLDDIKIYNQKAVTNVTVENNTDVGIIYKPASLAVKFDTPINYTGGGITIVDSLGTPVLHTGEYSPESLTYTATFNSALPKGDYKVLIDNTVTPYVLITDKITSPDFSARELPIKIFDTMPPEASNVEIEGRVIPGTQIIADYNYYSEGNEDEGASIYEWYMDSSADGSFSMKIDNAEFKELDVTEAMLGKYIKFKVYPVSASGLRGLVKESNVIAPEKAPVANNLRLSSTTLFANSYISAVYDYADENGDEETSSDIRWYTADSVDGVLTEVGEGRSYYIKEADLGKYIKCSVVPKNAAQYEGNGTTYLSEFAGPVADVLSTTNLHTNGGFEDGITGWSYSGVWSGIEVTDKASHTGDYALHLNPRKANTDRWGQNVPVSAGNVYISSCYARKVLSSQQDIVSFWPYSWEATQRGDTEAQYSYTLGERWTQVVGTFIATANASPMVGPVAFVSKETCDAYIDDMYFGELLVTDIETFDVEPVTIPENGNVKVAITSGKVLNQVGTQHGLWNEKVEIIIPEIQGVKLEGKDIVVSENALPGTITAEIRCIPSYDGANQTIFQKFVEVEILPHNDKTPKVFNVSATGSVETGNTVVGSYDFYQVDGMSDLSTVRWMYSDSANGVYYDIIGANSLNYTVEAEYADKYLKFVVSPKSDGGYSGEDVRSNYITKPREPEASDVSVSGSFNVGGILTGNYKYFDPNGDTQGTATYQWYEADSANGSYNPIPGATSESITLDSTLTGKYIKLGVTPVSSVAPQVGAEVLSEAYSGPCAPVAENVVILRDGNRLYAEYDFYHKHNARENGSIYKWSVDGTVVSGKIDYIIDFIGTKTVAFTITPVAESSPSNGKPVTVTALVTGNAGVTGGNTPVGGFVGGGSSSGGGGGSSSGSGGGSSSGGEYISGVVSINDMNLDLPEKEEKPTEPASDIDGHWGEKYIREMEEHGVMSADENGNYNPDEVVTRENMLTYLFKALKLETTEYNAIFEDVKDGDFANILQTMVDNGTIAVDTKFRPNDDISREEMCKILYVSLKNAGKLEVVESGLIESFDDYLAISEWAVEYVNAIYGNKIMIGVSEDRFAPAESLTKAQCATLLSRIIKLVEGEE